MNSFFKGFEKRAFWFGNKGVVGNSGAASGSAASAAAEGARAGASNAATTSALATTQTPVPAMPRRTAVMGVRG